jgi:hypothetical protein
MWPCTKEPLLFSLQSPLLAAKGRLRDVTDEERREVTLYISSLRKTKDSEDKAAANP